MLKDFISEVKRGSLARNNRYAVMFTPPNQINPAALQKVLLFCDQIQLPGVNYSTVQNRSFGELREVPYDKLYDNLTMSFYVDTDMKVKTLFDDWISSIQDPTTRTFSYYNDYVSTMTIEVQDLQNKTRYEMTLSECYPKNIGSIQLDYGNKDFMKMQVTMQYKYWSATPISPLAEGQKIPTTMIDKFSQNFTGFQQQLNGVIGERAGNFITGALGSAVVTKISGKITGKLSGKITGKIPKLLKSLY
jgi:hypothetical protein